MSARRFDSLDLTLRADSVGADGILRARARLTRTGVFAYRRADGSTVRELRHPDDVFAPEHLASLRQLPITEDHPAGGMVTADNFKDLAVGSTGAEVTRVDGRWLEAPIMIGDAGAVAGVTSGRKKQTSLGYRVAIVKGAGTYKGQRYDQRQTSLVANHLALVIRGRAGNEGNVRLDSQDAVLIGRLDGDDDRINGDDTMAKIRIDGVEYEIPDGAAAVVQSKVRDADAQTKRADALDVKLGTAEATAVAEKARADKAIADLEAVKATGVSPEARADAMKAARARLSLEAKATAAGVEFKADTADGDLRDSMIAKLAPDMDLEGRSDDARDAILDVLSSRVPAVTAPKGRQALTSRQARGDAADGRTDSEAAFIEAMAGSGYGTVTD